TESLKELPLRWVPVTAKEMRELGGLVAIMSMEGKATKPSWMTSAADTSKPPESKGINVSGLASEHKETTNSVKPTEWSDYPMPFGKNAGVLLGKLPKNYLFGSWANYVVETEYKGKPKSQES